MVFNGCDAHVEPVFLRSLYITGLGKLQHRLASPLACLLSPGAQHHLVVFSCNRPSPALTTSGMAIVLACYRLTGMPWRGG